ncbi:MAG: transcription termination/antitermination NusG family protein, partial [Ferruginibacter sp.]
LTDKGIENYCPTNRVEKQWSDRKKIILEPLFKGYVFIRINENIKWDIKHIPGIINYVYWLGKPAKVKQIEIDTIKMFLKEFDNVVVSDTIDVDKRVSVKQGVLMNYHGLVLQNLGNRVKVLINSMGITLTALFETKDLELLN